MKYVKMKYVNIKHLNMYYLIITCTSIYILKRFIIVIEDIFPNGLATLTISSCSNGRLAYYIIRATGEI